MSRKIKWGVISTANIGVQKVIPAMQKCEFAEITGIASRNESTAKKVAGELGIPKHYSSYEALLEDPEIEAIYNPLPNHLHLEWTEKAIQAGKHVLCEKPLVLRSEDVIPLIKLRNQKNVKVGEAFMVHTHPQWIDTVSRIKKGELGKLKMIQGFFSYYNVDENNIRNVRGFGGGGLWDIGCYPIHTSRYAFGTEPIRVIAQIENDPKFGTDAFVSALMEFQTGQASFHCSTQLVPYQKMSFFGDKKKLELDIPFNAHNDQPSKVRISDGMFTGNPEEVIEYDICDQYQIQGDEFSKAILNDTEVPVSLENAERNVRVIEAMFRSARSGQWEDV